MKETAPKKTWFQTLRTLWVPLAIGVVTVAALAVVVGMVWKDYRTAMMDSQTRQMELVVQSTADSIRVLLEEYADRLDSIAGKAEASKAFRPTVARSDTIRDVWLENSNGEVIYSCYGISAVCDVLITRTEDISYWQYHSGDEHYLVMKKKAGDETACLVVDSTVMYQQLISEIHVGRNGYIMIKNDDNLVVMHPEAVQWGIKVVEGRQRIYQGKELDMSSLSELLRAQQEEESGTLDYYSYWWADPDLPRVHKISAFRHLDVGGSFWIVSAVVDYDDFYEPVQQSFEGGPHLRRRGAGAGALHVPDVPAAGARPPQRDRDQRSEDPEPDPRRAPPQRRVAGPRPAAADDGDPHRRHRP